MYNEYQIAASAVVQLSEDDTQPLLFPHFLLFFDRTFHVSSSDGYLVEAGALVNLIPAGTAGRRSRGRVGARLRQQRVHL